MRGVDLVTHGWLPHHSDNRALEDQFPQKYVVSTPPSTGAAYLPAVRPPGSAREERTVDPGTSGLVSLVLEITSTIRAAAWHRLPSRCCCWLKLCAIDGFHGRKAVSEAGSLPPAPAYLENHATSAAYRASLAREAASAAPHSRKPVYGCTRPPPGLALIIHGNTAGAFTRMPFLCAKERSASRAT